MKLFEANELKKLYKPEANSNGEDNGQVTIIGGSSLFHGAPLFGVTLASKIVDMVFFSSPEPSLEDIAKIKAGLFSFVWVPFEEVGIYIEKSDAILIGPGLMRYKAHDGEKLDGVGEKTRKITHDLLKKFPHKKWVIDAGSLQTINPDWIPKNAILTPNKKEYEMLFGKMDTKEAALKYNCIIVRKGPVTTVTSLGLEYEIHGGNPGLTKGGTGDTQAGITVALLAKNEPILAACAGALLVKRAAEELAQKQGVYYNADDLSVQIPQTLSHILTS